MDIPNYGYSKSRIYNIMDILNYGYTKSRIYQIMDIPNYGYIKLWMYQIIVQVGVLLSNMLMVLILDKLGLGIDILDEIVFWRAGKAGYHPPGGRQKPISSRI